MRVALTVVIWLLLAVVAAIITAFVRDIPQLGLKGSVSAIWDTGPTTPLDRRWWATFMDWVILLASLIVAVRIVYPPKDLDDASQCSKDCKDSKHSQEAKASKDSKDSKDASTSSSDSTRNANGPSDL